VAMYYIVLIRELSGDTNVSYLIQGEVCLYNVLQ